MFLHIFLTLCIDRSWEIENKSKSENSQLKKKNCEYEDLINELVWLYLTGWLHDPLHYER